MTSNRESLLIIGGTSGIGLYAAQKLSSQYRVFVAGRRKLEKMDGVELIQLDVQEESSVQSCFCYLSKQLKGLSALVYSAGVTVPKAPITEFSKSDWERVMNINVVGAILSLKYAFPLLKQEKGRVVLINSIAGRTYSQLSGYLYTISKSAMSGLARQIAAEWAEYGILVNSLYPSMTKTPMLEENVEKEVLQEVEAAIPIKRIALQEEVSSAIEFLISPKNSYMTGCGLDINGGQYFN
ncbi:SDR family oxidoreductase [bacterium]|nr:SDR family oxidoreductase [bacterium]